MTKRPPVFFTVAAIRHEPIAALSEYIPRLQDALRKKGYSGQFLKFGQEVRTEGFQLSDGETPATSHAQRMYQVFTPDRLQAFTFNDNGVFAYHTSDYISREATFAQFRMGLEVLDEAVKVQQLTRVGIRMLDLIRPSDVPGRTLRDYLAPSLLGFSTLSVTRAWTPATSLLEQRFIDGDSEVMARFDYLPDGFGINVELFPTIRGHALKPHLTSQPGTPHGILDIDSGTRQAPGEVAASFNVDAVMTALGHHKDRISAMFRAAVTSAALDDWGLR
jgi:uncharacterized protein (TIGR04255 family)